MNPKKLKTIGLGAFALLSAVMVSFLSLISMELAVAVFALASVAFIVTLERTRRANWEQSVDFRFMHINKKHDALARDVYRQPKKAPVQKQPIKQEAKQPLKQTIKRPVATPNKPISFHDIVSPKTANDAYQGAMNPEAKPKPLTKPSLPKEEITKRTAPKMTVLEDANSLSDMVVEELTEHALKNERIDIFMQPIMRLPQRQRRFYEVFSRVRAKAGVYIPAQRYIDLAEKNKQLQDIDSAILSQSLILLMASAQSENPPSFFINVTAKTLKDGKFMGKLLAFLSKNRPLAEKLIFELSQEEFHDLPVPVLQIIRGLAKLGCSFSLDHVKSLEEDIGDLQRFNIRFLKVEASVLIEASKDELQYKKIMKAKRILEGNSIGLIAEKIEDEEMMRKLLDYNPHYGQGYLFGRPDLRAAYDKDLRARRA